jgi:hypothetical protein
MGAVGWIQGTLRPLTGTIVVGALTSAVPATASASICQAWTAPRSVGAGSNFFFGVALTSGCGAWAVGKEVSGQNNESLIEHWDGTRWSVQRSPDPSASNNVLVAAAATSRSNAWAVGTYHDDSEVGTTLPLILHWNGSRWTRMASAITGGQNSLGAVAATSAANAWAVGTRLNRTTREYQALILHWNGTTWAKQHSPAPRGATSFLEGVAATSAINAWAVGYYFNATSGRQSLILHWNGNTWTQVPSPNPGPTWTQLFAVTATSTSNAWAAGTYYTSDVSKTLIEHWNGTTWTQAPSPSPGGSTNSLNGVAASSATSAWAVGDYAPQTPLEQPLVEHWNGTAWTQVPNPDPGGSTGQSVLAAVAARYSSAGAAGYYYDDVKGADQPLALHF